MAGPDDLLLLLVQHWARDEHVYPTEDDRHDVATILLFQSYTGGRPAEFVHSSKGKASEDPLGEVEETNKNTRAQERKDKDDDKDSGVDDCLEFDDDSDAGDGPKYDDDLFDLDSGDLLFDSDCDSDDDGTTTDDKGTDETADRDSGYSSDCTDATDVSMTEDPTTAPRSRSTLLDSRYSRTPTGTNSTSLVT